MGQPSLILLDTHVVVWLVSESGRLSPAARSAIRRSRETGQGLAIVDITLLELAGLAGKGRLHLAMGTATLLEHVQSLFIVRPITALACAKMLELPPSYPRDPADRIIGATALVEGSPLITSDEEILRSKAIATIW